VNAGTLGQELGRWTVSFREPWEGEYALVSYVASNVTGITASVSGIEGHAEPPQSAIGHNLCPNAREWYAN
jgi:hypothetical protein